MVGALGGRGSEPELAMRPKVKPRQSIVREGETFLVSPSFFGENSQNPWRVSALLTLERPSHLPPHRLQHYLGHQEDGLLM